jgi:ribonuclease III
LWGSERVVLNNIFHRLYNRFHPIRFSYLSRDAQYKSLIVRLCSNGFDFAGFEKAIHHRPRNWKLFLHALLHRSYLQMINEKWDSNERLEFLGDAILNFIVAEHLFKTYPDVEEGSLTKMRSRLVNRKILAQRAKGLHLSQFLLLSTSAAQSIDSGSESIMADAFESIVGALYLDGGLVTARKFIFDSLFDNSEIFNMAMTDDNYKSALLEYAQARSLGIPKYSVLHEEGPEHDRRAAAQAIQQIEQNSTVSQQGNEHAALAK